MIFHNKIYVFIVFLVMLLSGVIFSQLTLASLIDKQHGEQTELHAAVKDNDIALIKRLVNKIDKLNNQDDKGWTALMYAVQLNNLEMVSRLLAAGASPNIADKLGRTPLELATNAPALITIQLIQAGAELNSRNAGGISVIMIAAGQGRQDLVELLRDAGAHLDYKDYQGNTVMDWAKRSGNVQLTNYILPHFKKAIAETHTTSGVDFVEDIFADAVHPTWFKASYLDLDEDLNDAMKDGKKGLMVYFGLKRCSYCQAFIENTLSKPDIEQRVQRLFDSVGLSIFSDLQMTDPTGKSYIVKDYVTLKKANYSPTMIFYGKNGRELLKIVGYYPPDKFRHVLDYLEGKHYENERLYTYIKRHKSKSGLTKAAIKSDKLFPNTNYTLYRKTKPAHRPLMVLFEQPDCDACDRFHKRVLTDKPVRRLLEQFDTLQIDATDTKTVVVTPGGSRISPKTWYYHLGLNYSPAMVFFDEAGNEIMRLDSETKRWRMEGTLQLIMEKSYMKDTQVQRWRRDKAVEFYQQHQAMQ